MQAFAWASSHIDRSWLSPCCTTEDPQRYDLTSVTEMDPSDGHIGAIGQISEPVFVSHRSARFSEPTSPLRAATRPPNCDEGSESAAADVIALRELMKQFVREFVRGKFYDVVIENGQTEPCELSLSQNLMAIQLKAAGVTHEIQLKNVKDVRSGKSVARKSAPIMLDDLCSTLILRSDTYVTFKLTNLQERDDFTKCIKVLALSVEP